MYVLHVTGNPPPQRPLTLPAPVQAAASGQCRSCRENPGLFCGVRGALTAGRARCRTGWLFLHFHSETGRPAVTSSLKGTHCNSCAGRA